MLKSELLISIMLAALVLMIFFLGKELFSIKKVEYIKIPKKETSLVERKMPGTLRDDEENKKKFHLNIQVMNFKRA